ncbi:MAG: ABC transporter substrate-binding protein [Actinomycetota bacterium]
MTHHPSIRRPIGLLAILLALAMVAAACGSDDDGAAAPEGASSSTSAETGRSSEDGAGEDPAAAEIAEDTADETTAGGEETADEAVAEAGFPIDVETSSGTVTIAEQPSRIVSLSPTATEILFAVGAGDQVVAVDIFSNHPADAPEGTLDGFTPDLEAILATEPDLVVATGLPEDITAGLESAGVVVMFNPAAASFDDTFDQVAQLGEATGNLDGAAAVNAEIRAGIEEVLASLPTDGADPVRVFHEIDDSFYTASSASFIGQVYAEMGFENIADPLDDGSGFPLIDGESIIAADPTLIVFTDQVGYGVDEITARPGWDQTTAVASGNVVQVDADIASRWGPRIVEFMQAIADTLLVSS